MDVRFGMQLTTWPVVDGQQWVGFGNKLSYPGPTSDSKLYLLSSPVSGRERERERDRDRETDRQTDRQRLIDSLIKLYFSTVRDRETETDRQTDRQTD